VPKVIRLSFDRNLDDTIKYNVYRDVSPGIDRTNEKVMEIVQPLALTNIEQVKGEVLTGDTNFLTYKGLHRNWVNDDENYPVKVFINGVPQASGFEVDFADGRIVFDVALAADDVVAADYHYDAVVALDIAEEQPGVTMLGAPAKDKAAPTAPKNLSIVANPLTNEAILTWQESTDQGTKYFYKVEAEDEAGNYSAMTAEVDVTLTAGLHQKPYIIESSKDGESWEVVRETDELQYVEAAVDVTPPETVAELTASVTAEPNAGFGDVTLTWINPSDDCGTLSKRYRVRARDAEGNYSSYAAVESVEVKSGLDKIVIKRKIDDGTYPEYNDSSDVVVEITDFEIETYTDAGLADGTGYAYSVFIVDKAGNVSEAATVQAFVTDVTSPSSVTGLQAKLI